MKGGEAKNYHSLNCLNAISEVFETLVNNRLVGNLVVSF